MVDEGDKKSMLVAIMPEPRRSFFNPKPSKKQEDDQPYDDMFTIRVSKS